MTTTKPDTSKAAIFLPADYRTRRPGRGAGAYINPVLAGDRPDPSVLKDGDVYYLTCSSFIYSPGLMVWSSRDLLTWRPIGPALTTPIRGSVFAPDLVKVEDRFFIYFPVISLGADGSYDVGVFVVHADRIEGPWSDPIDLRIPGYIDPGHGVGEDGRRYLFLNQGMRVRLSADGLSTDGEVQKVYDGWAFPQEWAVEGHHLEGPKILRRDGWFYMFAADGGTAGPPTGHMVIVARSRSIDGPWENAPNNPLIRTLTRDEPWWSRGHATPVEGPDGDWWILYHAYENGLRTLGRQMLLEPITWSADGWPEAGGDDLRSILASPVQTAVSASQNATPGHEMLGANLVFYQAPPEVYDRLQVRDGAFQVGGIGDTPASSAPLTIVAGDPTYEVEVELEIAEGAEAGLLLLYNGDYYCGLGVRDGVAAIHSLGKRDRLTELTRPLAGLPSRLFLRVLNDRDVATFSWSPDGTVWTPHISFEVSGYNQNVGGTFLSLRPAVYGLDAAVTVRRLAYRPADPRP